MITPYNGVVWGVVYLEDVLKNYEYPYFNVRISNMYHVMRNWAGEEMSFSKESDTVLFQFEAGDVNMISMVNAGLAWPEVVERYSEPRSMVALSSLGSGVWEFVRELLVAVVLKKVLRI